MSYVASIRVGSEENPIGSSLYGECTTTKYITEKFVYGMEDVENILKGLTIHVKFHNTNAAENPTLKIGKLGAKPILRYSNTPPGITPMTSWPDGAVVSFTYDLINDAWMMNDSNNVEDIVTSIETPITKQEVINYSF